MRYTLIEYTPIGCTTPVRAYLEGDVHYTQLHPTRARVIEDQLCPDDIPEDTWVRTLDDHPDALPYVSDPDDQEWDDPMMGGRDPFDFED